MSDTHLDPAKSIIAKIGIENVARVTGKHVSRVYRWMYPKERGGTGGLIPQGDAPTLLAYAKENAIDLSPADFFPAAATEPLSQECTSGAAMTGSASSSSLSPSEEAA